MAKHGNARAEREDSALSRAALGDRAAFGELYEAHAGAVMLLCRRMLGGADQAEGASSEVFLRAWRGLAGYDRRRPFRAWLLSIAAHHCIDLLRLRQKEGRLEGSAEFEVEQAPAPGPTPLSAVLARERLDALLAALSALPDRYRAVLTLRYFAELGYEEIASMLGVSVEHVGVLLFRAKQRARSALAQGDAG